MGFLLTVYYLVVTPLAKRELAMLQAPSCTDDCSSLCACATGLKEEHVILFPMVLDSNSSLQLSRQT